MSDHVTTGAGFEEALAKLPEAMREAMRARFQQPEVRAMLGRHLSTSSRRPLAFAFASTPLPVGVTVIIRLGEPEPLVDYAVVVEASFDDSIFQSAIANAHLYLVTRGTEALPAELVVYADGAVEATDEKGIRSHLTTNQPGRLADLRRNSGPILGTLRAARQIGQMEKAAVRGHGEVLIVRRDHPDYA